MLGAVLDIFSAIVLVVPLILPVAAQYNMHPVHLGIVFLAAMGLGYIDTTYRDLSFYSELQI